MPITKAKDVKHLEGSFPVDGKETPITHEPIEDLYADRWELMQLQDLQKQYIILNRRLLASYTTPNLEIIKQLQQGMVRLQYIIDERDEDTKLI